MDKWKLRPQSGRLLKLGNWRPPFWICATGINKLWVSFGQLGTTAAKWPPSLIGQLASIIGSLLFGNWWKLLRAFLIWCNCHQKSYYGSLLDNWKLRPRSSRINKRFTIIGQLMRTTTAAKKSPFIGQLGTTAAGGRLLKWAATGINKWVRLFEFGATGINKEWVSF